MRKSRFHQQYIHFLRWFAERPRPWVSRSVSDWETRWNYWSRCPRATPSFLIRPFGNYEVSDDAYRHAIQKAFYYWKQARYIEIKEDGDRLMVALTEKGERRFFTHEPDAPLLPKGKVLLILFDIPIEAREARDSLRYLLKQHAFKQLQQSVWCSDRDWRILLQKIFLNLNIDKWILFGILDMESSFITVKKSHFRKQQEKRLWKQITVQRQLARRKIK